MTYEELSEPILKSEIYSSIASCKNGIASVAKNAPIAEIEDQTKEGFEKVSNPKFELYTDKKSPKLEKRIEKVFTDHEVFYQKSETWIESERMYEVLYELTL